MSDDMKNQLAVIERRLDLIDQESARQKRLMFLLTLLAFGVVILNK